MKRPLFLFLTLWAAVAWAQEPLVETITVPKINPLVTMPARTLLPGQLALQRAPGMNIGSSFLQNSFNVGVFPRFEIGTTPYFYLISEHNWNANMKLNFWKGDWVDSSLLYNYVNFEADLGTGEKAELVTRTWAIALTLHPPELPWMTSIFLSHACSYLENTSNLNFIYSFDCRSEVGFDVQWEFQKNTWITLGTARLRDAGILAYEKMHGGSGFALSRLYPGKLISRPSVGAYYVPATSDVLYLLSTTFYEM